MACHVNEQPPALVLRFHRLQVEISRLQRSLLYFSEQILGYPHEPERIPNPRPRHEFENDPAFQRDLEEIWARFGPGIIRSDAKELIADGKALHEHLQDLVHQLGITLEEAEP